MKFNEYFKLRDVTVNTTHSCNLKCSYCLSGDTLITMADLTKKPIKNINIGDRVVGFNEEVVKNKQRALNSTIVTGVFSPRFVKELYKIVMDNDEELFITGEHPICDGRNKWTTPNRLYNKTERIVKQCVLPSYMNNSEDFSNDYKIGYIVSCFLGDGLCKKYNCPDFKTKKPYDGYRVRFSVKDVEITNRLIDFLKTFNVNFYEKEYKISAKYNMLVNSVFSTCRETYIWITTLIENNLNKNTSEDYLRGFLAGIYDCEGSYGKDGQVKISNGNEGVINQIKTALNKFNIKYTFKPSQTFVNILVYTFRVLGESIIPFLELVNCACKRKRMNYEGKSLINRIGIKSIEKIEFNDYVYNFETESHTYIANNILVHNCFENHKSKKRLTNKQVEIIIDKCYINYLKQDNKQPFVISFFGGEPFLNFEVIEHALKYAREKDYKIEFGATTNLTILTDHMIDIIEEYELGLLVSIDGIKEIHDRNRCNSYDKVKENVQKLVDRDLEYLLEARMTIMPADVSVLLESIQSIVDMGIVNIAPVPVTDTVWTDSDIKLFKNNLTRVWRWLFNIYNDDENRKNISIKFIEDYLEKVLTIEAMPEQTQLCFAGTNLSCSIGANGDIMPCHQRHTMKDKCNDLIMGNIFDDNDIKEVKFNDCSRNGAFDCNECVAQYICKGGCPSENLTINGCGNKMNENQCKIYQAMVEVAINFQNDLLKCSNIRSRRLNGVAENLKILEYFKKEVLGKDKTTEEYYNNLVKLYELIMDKEMILLPLFNECIRRKITELININNELRG